MPRSRYLPLLRNGVSFSGLRKVRLRRAVLAPCVLAAGISSVPAQAADFLDVPGRWVTALLSDGTSSKLLRQADWQCHGQDGSALRILNPFLGNAGTAIADRGEQPLASKRHYAGAILETRPFNGGPVRYRIHDEASPTAACTPAD